ncbi:MAG: alpha-N-arabinofuranosidase [Kiritimatiellia bacterium]|jgi:alpha-N-arabinofuranosidase
MNGNIILNRDFAIGEAEGTLYGGFIEHLGRAVHTGIYEPGHPTADADGLRDDVAALVRDLDMPLTRYPGGNFVSGFDWKDAIGPKDKRPVRPDYAWQSLETNEFGLDEFVKWCRKANTKPFYAVNLGTGTPKSAQEIVEYCNFPKGSAWSDLRRANGADAPHGITHWCLGNEMDGDWQIGHKTAVEYGRIAYETAKMMKMVDPSIKLAACGSSTRGMSTFGAWDYDILRECLPAVDYLSIHAYFANREKDLPAFLASPEQLGLQIAESIACCDAAAAALKSPRKLMLALDEWNVWYHAPGGTPDTEWQRVRPLFEEAYDMADVLVVGGLLMTMLAHADRLKIGCIAQTVNVIAPITTVPGGPVWKQTIYYPFWYASRYGRGTSLRLVVESPTYQTPRVPEPVKFLHAAAVHNAERNEIALFALNRSPEESLDLTVALQGFAPTAIVEAVEIRHDDLDATNDANEQRVKPAAIPDGLVRLDGDKLQATLSPLSWNCIRIAAK